MKRWAILAFALEGPVGGCCKFRFAAAKLAALAAARFFSTFACAKTSARISSGSSLRTSRSNPSGGDEVGSVMMLGTAFVGVRALKFEIDPAPDVTVPFFLGVAFFALLGPAIAPVNRCLFGVGGK